MSTKRAARGDREKPERDGGTVGRTAPVAIPADIPAEQLAALLAVSGALASSLDLPTVLQTAVEGAVRVLGLETGAIYTIEGERLLLGATTPPLPAGFPDALRTAPLSDHPHIRRSVATGEPVFLPDTSTAELTPAERAAVDARRLTALLYVPLVVKGAGVGALILGSTTGAHEFAAGHVHLARALAFEIGLAVANARLFETVRRANDALAAAYDATIEGWTLALEMRDAGTNGHTLRVTDLTVALARHLGVPEEEVPHLRRGALLHDIGKMAVPDGILNKSGPLTDEEWAVMRSHPDRARDLLSRTEFLAPALAIPYGHHERWDGSGYPRGLRGEEIPLAARIFAVVDVFDALVSDRPYRPAWPRAAVLAHLREESGRAFDPAVVDAFLALLQAEIPMARAETSPLA